MATISTVGPFRCTSSILGRRATSIPGRPAALQLFYRPTRRTEEIRFQPGAPLLVDGLRKYSTEPLPPSGSSSSNRSSKASSPSPETNSSQPSFQSTETPDQEARRSSDPAVPNPTPEDELPSLTESRRARFTAAFQGFMDNTQRAATEASNWASKATGTSYRVIERLKLQNAELELELAKAREDLVAKRKEYQSVVQRRLQTQREVNTLLARKDSWTPPDLERFTILYRDDHTLDSAVTLAGEKLAAAEREAEKIRERLVTGILGRYHEEQIWSDRIRRLSTWGTWGLMTLNVVLFLAFQFGAEPWRRARLVRGFEEKVAMGVKKAFNEERQERPAGTAGAAGGLMGGVIPALVTDAGKTKEYVADSAAGEELHAAPSALQAEASSVAEAEDPPPIAANAAGKAGIEGGLAYRKDFLLRPGRWKAVLFDLGSERIINITMRDASLLVVEGAAAGAVVAGGLLWLLVVGGK